MDPESEPESERERRVRSFVRRQGRMTGAQERAFEQHWARFGLELSRAPIDQTPTARERDFSHVFGRLTDLVLEIGFGNGEQLLHAAANDPARDYIGVEVHRPGVGRLLNGAAAANLTNVRAYCHDAVEVLRDAFADESLAEVRIYFPDPWPKTRQQKRRIVQPEFVALVARKLRAGGLLHLATDWQDYALHMLAVADACPALRNVAGTGEYSPCPPWRSETHFERRGRRLGHGVWDLLHERR
jgi:tRNA (guanine-N7-)-methyltransferase